MKKCLDCKNLETSMVDYRNKFPSVSEYFSRFLKLYCKKKKVDVIGYDKKGDEVYCKDCCCTTQYEENKQDAIKNWNKRV